MSAGGGVGTARRPSGVGRGARMRDDSTDMPDDARRRAAGAPATAAATIYTK